MVRTTLYEAAQILLVRPTKWSWLKAWAMQIARRRGIKREYAADRVSAPRYRAGSVDLARLVLSAGQSKHRPDRLGFSEAGHLV
jgi:hypothetical protein